MIDKLDLGIPKTAPYTRSFVKLLTLSERPEWRDKVWKDGGHYRQRGDLREVSGGDLPVILHKGNRHNSKADDKVELIETGKYSLEEMKSTVRGMYVFPPDEARVMRLDTAADIQGTPVEWFRQHTYFKFKQTNRAWVETQISQRSAQTLLSGQKPNQFRVYDKTGHRKMILASEVRKMRPSEREFAMSFEDRWGYASEGVVTRIERQIGAGQPKALGYSQVGNLYKLSFADPFERLVFPEDLDQIDIDHFTNPYHRITAQYLRDRAQWDGVNNTRDYLRDACKHRGRDSFYRLWNIYKGFVLSSEGGGNGITRAGVRRSFLASLEKQLAA